MAVLRYKYYRGSDLISDSVDYDANKESFEKKVKELEALKYRVAEEKDGRVYGSGTFITMIKGDKTMNDRELPNCYWATIAYRHE